MFPLSVSTLKKRIPTLFKFDDDTPQDFEADMQGPPGTILIRYVVQNGLFASTESSIFLLPMKEPHITIKLIRESFPLSGSFHFRVRAVVPAVMGFVWLDLHDE